MGKTSISSSSMELLCELKGGGGGGGLAPELDVDDALAELERF